MSPAAPGGGSAPSLVLFDPSGTAHSGNAIEGLARAARRADLDVTVHAPAALQPSVRSSVEGPGLHWVPAEVGAVLPGRRARRAHRAALARALDDARATGGMCCDLGLGRTVQSRGARLDATARDAFVCHQTNFIDPVVDRGRGQIRAARRIARNRGVLRGIGTRGGQVVVHTAVARERVTELVPAPQVHVLGWPVVAEDAACLAPGWQAAPEGVTLLFAGSTRLKKGLGTLLGAISSVPSFDRLVVPGRLNDRLRAKVDLSDPRVELGDRWLSGDEYRQAFTRASLVVLPYQRAYLERGTYSSVLAEAMAHGRPLLVSEPLAPLLPPGYRGAVVADAETESGLAAGLGAALADLDALERAAMSTGREHVRRHHTYEGYLDGLRRACGVAGATRAAP